MPVVVGPLTTAKVPPFIADYERTDLSDVDGRERHLTKLTREIVSALGLEAPITIPAALFAVNKEQFRQLMEPVGPLISLEALCTSVGMWNPREGRARLAELLEGRYGNTWADFTPFGEKPIKKIVEDAVTFVNSKRKPQQKRVWIRWDTVELLNKKTRADPALSKERRSSSCLTIVDSISAFHDTIQDALLNMSFPAVTERSGIVWVPPIFRDAASVERTIEDITNNVRPIQDAYLDFSQLKDRWVTFYTATPSELRQWLRQAISALAKDPDAVPENRKDMEDEFPPPRNPPPFGRKVP
jgi:hypothetical protein